MKISDHTPLGFRYNHAIRKLVVAGCGGSGSHWIQSIALMLYDMERKGLQTPAVYLVDPDRVEEQNIGRQMFIPADLGQPKCEVLARRLNLMYGLDFHTFDTPFEAGMARGETLLCGAVDNAAARREMSKSNALWIDAGNHFSAGQVIVGTSSTASVVEKALVRAGELGKGENDLLSKLPNAALCFPSLLDEEEVEEYPNISCAEAVALGEQSLLINQQMAAIAAQYTHLILHQQTLMSFISYISSGEHGMTVRSVPTSPIEIRARLGEEVVALSN